MVHALAHSPRLQTGHLQAHPLKARPDPTRIAALSGAIAVNAIALLLLLLPISTLPPMTATTDADPSPPTLVPLDEPLVVPIEKFPQPRRSEPSPQPRVMSQPRADIAPVSAPVIVAQGSEAATPVVEAAVESNIVEPATGPVAAARLEYASAPPPAYPRDALRMRAEGTVMLQVLVDRAGRPLDVQVQASSGNRALDEAARKHVLKRWIFRPAMRDGVAVQAIGIVPIDFTLAR